MSPPPDRDDRYHPPRPRSRHVRFHVHAQPEEASVIDAAAAALGMSRSRYVLRAALNHSSAAEYISRPRRAAKVLSEASTQALRILGGEE
jgi:uncharacterized protein (DUF1778 family)